MTRRSLVGETLHGTYRIERLLVRGGMGSVYEASHSRLPSKRFAVKVLHTNAPKQLEAYRRFRREAQITTELGHPHIVEVIDFNETPAGDPYMVMEYLEGETLGARIRREKILPPGDVVMIARQVGSALHAAHQKGVVHRDIKPDNIFLLGALDAPIQVKILDFGISKIKKSETLVTGANLLLGTVRYMSPEQASAQAEEVDEKTDIFALAAICYEALTGVRPFDGPNLSTVIDQICEQPPAPADLPGPLRAVLFRALAKDKAMRTPSAIELADDLAAAISRIEEEEESIPTSVSPMMRSRGLSLVDDVADPTTDVSLPRGRWGAGRSELFGSIDEGLVAVHPVTADTEPELPLPLLAAERAETTEVTPGPAAQLANAARVHRLAPDDPLITGPFAQPLSFAEAPATRIPVHATSAAVVVDTPPQHLLPSTASMPDAIGTMVASRRLTGRVLWMVAVVGVLLAAALAISVSRGGAGRPRAPVQVIATRDAGARAATKQVVAVDGHTRAKESSQDAAHRPDLGPPEVTITLRLSPQDAEVRLDGQLVRKRVFRLARSETQHRLEVRAEGYRVFTKQFTADSSTMLVVALDPVEAARVDAGTPKDAGRAVRRADTRARRTPHNTAPPRRRKRLGEGLPDL